MKINYENWGLINFDEAFEKQKDYVAEIQNGLRSETVIFCRHSAVVTTGRKTEPGDITSWDGPTFEVNRGGRATYHGPSQVVIYPLLNLNGGLQKSFPAKDIHAYLRFLENLVLDFLAQYCVDGETFEKMNTSYTDKLENATGVWVSGKKIASLGIAIQKWITSHGVAIYLNEDELAFQGIKPCGFSIDQITNLEREIRKPVDYEGAVEVLKGLLIKYGLTTSD
jgi:lipoyl(octanoyl) transferase